LISQAAGRAVANVIKPMILNVHAGPSLRINPSMAKLFAAPPNPPAA
jgi:hypothetical protein